MYIFIGVLVALGITIWIGLLIKPVPFAPFPARSVVAQFATIPLPTDLPAPVERYYRHILGAETGSRPDLPVITSAVISGRAHMRIAGITFPARFRFTHRAGQDYRHYIEATWFGLPIMRVNERYLDGRGRMELPVGIIENEPNIDQAANLGLWAESIWLPSIFLTDPRLRWEPIDAHTALLIVPFVPSTESAITEELNAEEVKAEEVTEEHFVVRFDPETGVIMLMESMRYKEADDMTKTLWINQTHSWALFEPWLLPSSAGLIWLDDGTPWATFATEEVVYNVESSMDLDAYLQQRGP